LVRPTSASPAYGAGAEPAATHNIAPTETVDVIMPAVRRSRTRADALGLGRVVVEKAAEGAAGNVQCPG